MHFVYILRSDKDGKLYVGITANVENRLAYHNAGRVRSTKNRRPFQLIHVEVCPTRMAAREREVYLKSYKGSKEKALIVESALKALSSNG